MFIIVCGSCDGSCFEVTIRWEYEFLCPENQYIRLMRSIKNLLDFSYLNFQIPFVFSNFLFMKCSVVLSCHILVIEAAIVTPIQLN